jgi:hypothetical protein
MNTNYSRTGPGFSLQNTLLRRGILFGALIILALLAFEAFNYSTTEFALGDLLGGLRFLGIPWATILSIAFCGIDFAGIARLFTPEQGRDEPAEVWYLFGAWLLAAAMNAMLTWWGVSVAIVENPAMGNEVIDRATLLKAVPIFIAVMVWLIRVLLIGTFSIAGERLFGNMVREARSGVYRAQTTQPNSLQPLANMHPSRAAYTQGTRPAPKVSTPLHPESEPIYGGYSRPEPSYHPVSAQPNKSGGGAKRL